MRKIKRGLIFKYWYKFEFAKHSNIARHIFKNFELKKRDSD